MLKITLMLCPISLLLTSCATNGQGGDFCSEAHPVYLDQHDVLTPGTQRAILKLDEKGEIKCGWEPVG